MIKSNSRTSASRRSSKSARAHGDERAVALKGEQLDDLVDHDEFLRFQVHSLAVFATPENVAIFRLPNSLKPVLEVSDRFYIEQLLRSVSLPNAGYILALEAGRRSLTALPIGPLA